MQGADKVVVSLLRLVVDRRAALYCPREPNNIKLPGFIRRQGEQLLCQVEDETSIAIGHRLERCPRLVGQGEFSLLGFLGSPQQLVEGRPV